MNSNPLFHTPQCPPPSSPTAPFDPRSYYGPSAMHPMTYPYNMEWGIAQQQALLHNANQLRNQPTTSGPAPTTDNDHYVYKWLSGIPCHQGFPNFDDLMLHMRDAHDVRGTADRKLDCGWFTSGGACGKNYRRDGFRRHIGTHVRDSVPCTEPECDKTFSRSDSMRAHVKKCHSKK